MAANGLRAYFPGQPGLGFDRTPWVGPAPGKPATLIQPLRLPVAIVHPLKGPLLSLLKFPPSNPPAHLHLLLLVAAMGGGPAINLCLSPGPLPPQHANVQGTARSQVYKNQTKSHGPLNPTLFSRYHPSLCSPFLAKILSRLTYTCSSHFPTLFLTDHPTATALVRLTIALPIPLEPEWLSQFSVLITSRPPSIPAFDTH